MAGRQLPFVSLLVPAWLVMTMSGWRGFVGVWPAVLVCGGVFAVVQFAWSNFVGPELVDIVGGLLSLVALALFCRVWKPAEVWDFAHDAASPHGSVGSRVGSSATVPAVDRRTLVRAWMPWVFLSIMVILWGLGSMKALLNGGPAGFAAYRGRTPGGDEHGAVPSLGCAAAPPVVFRDFPVEAVPVDRARVGDTQYRGTRAEAARYTLNWLSATGTGILIAALADGGRTCGSRSARCSPSR